MTGVLAFLLRLGLGGMVNKAIGHIERRAELENDRERLQAMTTAELARQAVAEATIMADYNRAKLQVPWFWVFAGMFLVPLALWWSAVIIDSIPYLRAVFGDQQVSDLPTPEMQRWAGNMIQWLFFVGSGVGAIKVLKR